MQSSGRLLRDYHTAQVPGRVSLKNRPHNTRRDELAIPKEELNTILSTRDYRQDAACLVAIQANTAAPYELETIAQALQKPKYVLYLGRKSCPLALPAWPQIVDLNNALEAMEQYREIALKKNILVAKLERIVWGAGIEVGIQEDIQVVRKDRLLSRQHWQFGDRQEHIALLGGK